jgi:hypothetical protein
MIGRPPALSQDRFEETKRLYDSGLGASKVGLQLGVSARAVRYLLRKNGAETRNDDFAKIPLNDSFFDEIDTAEKAYWLGILITDGNIYGTRVTLNLKDREHLVKFAGALDGPTLPIKAKHKQMKDRDVVCFNLQFRSGHMVESLSKYGVAPRKSATSTPWNGPPELMSHFWRGCVDGDGWVFEAKPGRFAIGFCGTRAMVQAFSDFSYSVTGTRHSVCARSKIFVCNIGSVEAVRGLAICLYGNLDGASSLDRKLEKARLAIEARPPTPLAERRKAKLRQVEPQNQ